MYAFISKVPHPNDKVWSTDMERTGLEVFIFHMLYSLPRVLFRRGQTSTSANALHKVATTMQEVDDEEEEFDWDSIM